MFDIKPSLIKGCLEIQPLIFNDSRGSFVKTFHQEAFLSMGLETNFTEDYYTVSSQNVIRGMHFQLPPMDHVKLVNCIYGEVLDVIVDLRLGSPTYGKHALFNLSSAKGNILYLSKGLAHGFCVLSKKAILMYKVSKVYSYEHDSGILWSSIDVGWPTRDPIISDRDQGFLGLDDFISPFHYE